MGGAVGTPLLFTIFLLVAALIKKKQRKSNRGDPSTMSTQMTDIHMHMAETNSGMAKGSVEVSPSPLI